MSDAADPAGTDGLSEQERDAMVASLLGITTERLRTMRRVQVKREQAEGSDAAGGRGAPLWRCVDQLDDEALFAALRRSEVRARVAGRPHPVSPVDRQLHRSIRRR